MKCTCLTCGKSFAAKPSHVAKGKGKYCSRECWGISKLKGEERRCRQCGEPFYATRAEIKRGNPQFCSPTCGYAYKREHPSGMVEVTCEQCGEPFMTWPSRINVGHGRFCSVECYNAFQTKRTPRPCPYCGTVFDKKELPRGGVQYCSRRCANLAKRKRVKCTCRQCGIEFEIHEYAFNRGSGQFCSYECNRRYTGPTSIEILLSSCFEALGIEHHCQYGIKRWVIDVFVPPNFVFEADGNYWHDMPSAIEKDRRRDRWMKQHGYIVTRFSETELRADLEPIRKRISQVLRLKKGYLPLQPRLPLEYPS